MEQKSDKNIALYVLHNEKTKDIWYMNVDM